MVSEKLFQSCPAFPDDVPVAQLSKISLAKLASKDESEVREMFQACQQFGFFLLDLNNDPMGEDMIAELEEVFHVIEATMHLSAEEKEEHRAELPKKVWG